MAPSSSSTHNEPINQSAPVLFRPHRPLLSVLVPLPCLQAPGWPELTWQAWGKPWEPWPGLPGGDLGSGSASPVPLLRLAPSPR